MKRILAFLLVGMTLFLFASCGSQRGLTRVSDMTVEDLSEKFSDSPIARLASFGEFDQTEDENAVVFSYTGDLGTFYAERTVRVSGQANESRHVGNFTVTFSQADAAVMRSRDTWDAFKASDVQAQMNADMEQRTMQVMWLWAMVRVCETEDGWSENPHNSMDWVADLMANLMNGKKETINGWSFNAAVDEGSDTVEITASY